MGHVATGRCAPPALSGSASSSTTSTAASARSSPPPSSSPRHWEMVVDGTGFYFTCQRWHPVRVLGRFCGGQQPLAIAKSTGGEREVMGLLLSLVPFFFFLFFSSSMAILQSNDLPVVSFDDGYTQLFGDSNLMLLGEGKTVHISLDERTGVGFASQDLYLHGFFSASIKLPLDYAAGVVVTFYMSNGDVFEKTHEELDFKFLGNIRGKECLW